MSPKSPHLAQTHTIMRRRGNGRFCHPNTTSLVLLTKAIWHDGDWVGGPPYISFGSRINPITEFGSIPWDIHGRCAQRWKSIPKDGKLERPYLGAVRTTEDPAPLSKMDLSHTSSNHSQGWPKTFLRLTFAICNNVFKIIFCIDIENVEKRLTNMNVYIFRIAGPKASEQETRGCM